MPVSVFQEDVRKPRQFYHQPVLNNKMYVNICQYKLARL